MSQIKRIISFFIILAIMISLVSCAHEENSDAEALTFKEFQQVHPELKGEEAEQKYQEYLDSMYVRPVTVEEALRITGMSRSAFHVHFQESTGLTFCQYLNDLRLATADHLIAEGVPPDEAAMRSGFTSRSNYYQQRRNRRRQEP